MNPDAAPPDADNAHVLVFPPLLFLATVVLGVVLEWLVPVTRLTATPARIAGAVLFMAGFVLAAASRRALRKAGTNIHPGEPTLALVTTGPFGRSRNPLYAATVLLYLGVSLLVPAVWPIVLLVPMLAVLQWGVIQREERYLAGKFGAAYENYRSRVRRWF